MKRLMHLSVTLAILVFPAKELLALGKDKTNRKEKDTIQQLQILYDFSAGQFKDPLPRWVPEGSIVSLRYINLNPFAVSSNIQFESIDRSYTDGSSSLARLTALAGEAKEEAEDGDEKVSALKRGGNSKFSISEADTVLLDKSVNDLEKFNRHVSEISESASEIKEIMSLGETLEFAKTDVSITDAQTILDRLTSTVNSDIADAIKDHDLVSYCNVLLGKIQSDLRELNRLLDQFDQVDYKRFEKMVPDIPLGNKLATMRAMVDELTKTYTGENADKLLKNVRAIHNNISVVEHAAFEIISESTTANSDILTYSDELKDKDGKVIRKIAPIRMYTYGGHRINTSIGVATTFGDINGSEFYLKKNPSGSQDPADTGMVTLVESSKNRQAAFNPAIFIHYYPTQRRFCYWRVTTGFGPDFTDLNKTKLYLGGGMSFTPSSAIGTLSRIGLDVGIAAGYADVLKEKYSGYGNYAQFADLDSEDLVDRALKFGFFASLSFNLSPVKKEEKKD